MIVPNAECITNGCRNRVSVVSYWLICIDCYTNTPDHIPNSQVNLYNELKSEKEKHETSNDM
jgi:hypothetical protein